MWLRARLFYWVAVGATLFLVLGIVFDWNKSEWASWVQAVGSIAAILAAARIAGWQASMARREFLQRQRDADRAKASSIIQVIGRARFIIENAERASFRDELAKDLAEEQVVFIQGVLRALPVFEIPSPELVFCLHRNVRNLFYVKAYIRRAAERDASGRRANTALMLRVKSRLDATLKACYEITQSDAIFMTNRQ